MQRILSLIVVLAILAPAACRAGHSRFPYVDGGQSQDGRFVVAAKLIEHPAQGKKQPATHEWEYTWLDLQTKQELRGKLQGLRSGQNGVFEPVHAHIFVAPGGETFAVWNPQVLAPMNPTNQKPPENRASREYRNWSGFSQRLIIYRKTGAVVKQLDLCDFLQDEDWDWLYVYGRQVYWQLEFPGLTRDNAPRVGYAHYQVSPDYRVLEVKIGANAEATRKATERGVKPTEPRTMLIDLTSGLALTAKDIANDTARTPVRPFVGPAITAGGRGRMSDYIPSLDPVRHAGEFLPNAKN